jgi:hypothetical protein
MLSIRAISISQPTVRELSVLSGGRSRGRNFTFEFALIGNVLDPSKDLPPFFSYRFDILQAGFRDSGEFVDPSTGVGHEATVPPVVQIVQDVQPLRSVQDVEEQAWHKAPGNNQNRSVSFVTGVLKFTSVQAVRLAHPLPLHFALPL